MQKSTFYGLALVGLLFVLFLTLRLTGVIGWSWWLVTSPLWIPFAIGLLIALFSVAMIVFTVHENNSNRQN